MRLDHTPETGRTPATAARRAAPTADRAFAAELATLDLRLSVLLGRFDRLVRRAEAAHRDWHDDTERRMRTVAARAAQLQAAGTLAAREAERVRATLTVLARHLQRLEAGRAEFAAGRAAARG